MPTRNLEKKRKGDRRWREANREKCRESSRKHYWAHREELLEKCREKKLEQKRRAYAENPEKYLERVRKYSAANPERIRAKNLKKCYGITAEQYNKMTDKQNGQCAICGRGDKKLQVDHDHSTGTVRGLLCGGCNLGIGHLCDSPDLLQKAAGYLLMQ